MSRLLLVEDDESHALLIQRSFDAFSSRYELRIAGTLAEARALIQSYMPHLVMADMFLPDGKGTELIPALADRIPAVIITSQGNEQMAVEVIKAGALDYVVKTEASFQTLPHDAERALREWRHIVEAREALRDLRRSQEMYRALAEHASDAIFRYDHRLQITYANAAFEEVTGVTPDQAIGKTVAELGMPESLVQRLHNAVLRVFRSGKPYEVELKLASPAGTKYLSCQCVPEHSAAGLVESVLATARDVTDTKRLQEFVGRAARLETAGRIAGQVAHDFNNLLGPLVAYPDFIREELPEGHPGLPYLNGIEQAAEQMAEINQQLLTLGRRGHYNLDTLDLNGIILQTIASLGNPPSTLVIKTELSEKLMRVRGGSSQLSRMLLNMINNARDAMQNIGWLTIRTENYYADDFAGTFGQIPQGEYVRLTVQDTGCGIPDNVLPEIFDPFFTTKAADQKRGSGLGLSVVHAVVKDHSGYIDVETAIGEGSRFMVYIPITRDKSELNDTISQHGEGQLVLVVDDDEVQRQVTLHLLKKLNYKPHVAESGETALEIVKNRSFDLVILDMVMPAGMDGADTYREILAVRPGQRALIVSGYAETRRVELAMSLGASAFLRKPLTSRALASAVKKALSEKRTEREEARDES